MTFRPRRLAVLMLAGHVADRGEIARLARLAGRLDERGIDPTFLCLGGARPLMERGVGAIDCPWPRHRWLRPLAIRQFRNEQPEFAPAIVHALHEEVAASAVALASAYHASLVVTVEDFAPAHAVLRATAKRARHVLLPDERLTEAVSPFVPEERLTVCPFGIDVEAIEPRERTDMEAPARRLPVIGATESAIDGSGIETFVDALHLLVEAGRDLEALLALPPTADGAIRRRADRLGIADRLTFASPSTMKGAFWRVIDLYCQPDRSITIGRNLAVAMARGLPCVASDIEALRSVIEHGARGRLVPPGDPKALAEAIRALLEDPSTARNLAFQARAWARQHHDPEREADCLSALYKRLAEPSGSESA